MLELEGSRIHLCDFFISQMRKLKEVQRGEVLFHYFMLPHFWLGIAFQILAVPAIFAYIGFLNYNFFRQSSIFPHS